MQEKGGKQNDAVCQGKPLIVQIKQKLAALISPGKFVNGKPTASHI